MNKSDIYKIIGYQGEYNTNVKKALRKLLKENHPDNHGDRQKFELINEVKKELETGKTPSFKKASTKDVKDIDYDYCYKMLDNLKVKKNSFNELLTVKKEMLYDYECKYKDLYQKSLDLENNLLASTSYIRKLGNIKSFSIALLIFSSIIFIMSVIKKSQLLFIIFVALVLICVFLVQKYLFFVHKMTENGKRKLTNYVKMNTEIRKNVSKQNQIKKEIREIKKKLTNVENDLRFYKNLLK